MDTSLRDKHWNSIPVNASSADPVVFHAAGAGDPDTSYSRYLMLSYRFALEELVLKRLVKRHVPKRSHALDCGCGTGRITEILATHFNHIEAWDISQPFVEAARQRYPDIDFSVASFETMPEAKYDFIFVGGVFINMTDDEIRAALTQIRKRLAPNGVLITRDTITTGTKKGDLKNYHTNDDYVALFEGYDLVDTAEGLTRNFWCWLANRLPIQLPRLFSFLIRTTIFVDFYLPRKSGHRFFVFRSSHL